MCFAFLQLVTLNYRAFFGKVGGGRLLWGFFACCVQKQKLTNDALTVARKSDFAFIDLISRAFPQRAASDRLPLSRQAAEKDLQVEGGLQKRAVIDPLGRQLKSTTGSRIVCP